MDQRPAAARVGQEEERFRVPKLAQIGSTAFRAQNEERVVERIAGCSAARQYRNAQHSLHRTAGARVHDV
jgi:hypothetical protein